MSFGVHLIGYARYEMGLGESCRLAAKAFQAVKIPYGIFNFNIGTQARAQDLTFANKEITVPIYPVNIIHINALQMPMVYEMMQPWFLGRTNIAYWHWELPDFPDSYQAQFQHFEQIWVPSKFVQKSIQRKSPIPVHVIPHGIRVKAPKQVTRAKFNLPEKKFLFLTMYDSCSIQPRKNPLAVLKAFQKLQAKYGLPIGLVIKVSCGKPEEIKRLYEQVAEFPEVKVIEHTLSREETNALLRSVDCYVSLHRAEGFGLPIAEAMELAKPVIATNWSGNTDFMNPTNSGAVRFCLKRIGETYGPYEAHQIWAEPDIDHAVYLMAKVVQDQVWRKQISLKGQKTIHTYFSPEVSGVMMKNKLLELDVFAHNGEA